MTLEERIEALEKDFNNLKKQISIKDEQLTRFESILKTRIDEFSAYIDTNSLSARGISQ